MTLRLERVTRIVNGERHLNEIGLELRPGSLNVLLGPTLAGKTSLMRIMAGLDRPTSGRVIAGGEDVTDTALQKRSVAMVYQQFINYPSFTVYDNIASPLRRQGRPKAEIDAKVRNVARLLHIEPLLGRLPAELSGGQQQRCSIARALVKEAALLLLDEPLVNLDYKLREELRSELQALFARREAIVVYATTEPLEALVMGGEVLVVDQGSVLQQGPTLEVYHRPASTRVAEIFSDPPMNMIEGRVSDGRALLGPDVALPLTAHLADLPEGRYRFGVRANHLFMAQRSPAGIAITGEVELAEISGSETFVHVHHHEVSWVVQREGVHAHALGEAVTVHVDPAQLFVFTAYGRHRAAPRAASRA
ncbi:MAG TPA: ABC transporter ATP-binding protein [Geminicoccaceae bacterium]|nr:ABC transporter ATP-binding protein [Geminicoccaceae bacterium]